ncbi:MAG: hypothetical protein V3V85_00515 [Candidatus Thorarchaeota archaeon]
MKTKFQVGQLIFYMKDNRLHSAEVTSIMTVDNEHDDWTHTPEQKETWQPFGPSGEFYGTCHGIIDVKNAHATKEALTENL